MGLKFSIFLYSILAFSLQIILLKIFEYLLLFTNVTEILPLGILGISLGTITASFTRQKISPAKLERWGLAALAASLVLIVPAVLSVTHIILVGLSIICAGSLGFLVALNLLSRNFSTGYVFEILGSIGGVLAVWAWLPRWGAEALFLGSVALVGLLAGAKRAWAALGLCSALLVFVSVVAARGSSLNLIHHIRQNTNVNSSESGRLALQGSDATLLATRWSMLDRVDAISQHQQLALFFNDRQWSTLPPPGPIPFPFRPESRSALVIGVGAGRDIRNLRSAGVERIVGAEISPEVIELMRGPLYSLSEKIYDSAEIHNVDGRAFMRGSREEFDIILSRYPDLMKGGKASQTFSENYLWTEESFQEFFRLLALDGQFIFNRSVRDANPASKQTFRRFLATLAGGMRRAGIPAQDHGLVLLEVAGEGHYKYYFVMKRTPFTEKEAKRLRDFFPKLIPVVVPLRAPPPPPASLQPGALPSFDSVQEFFEGRTAAWEKDGELPDPATDDRPFLEYVRENALFSSFLMNVMLGSILLFVAATLVVGNRLGAAFYAPAAAQIHCFFSGVYFCLIEIYLIRRLNFFFGNPVQNMAVVLLTMLVGAAIPAALLARAKPLLPLRWLIALSPLAAALFFALEPSIAGISVSPMAYGAVALLILPIGIFSSFVFPHLCRKFASGAGVLYGLNLLGFFFGAALSLALGLELGNQAIFISAVAITTIQSLCVWLGQPERHLFTGA